ncbi:hypothetical protein [Gracilibacillus dipsosauri]|uniref:hypothetical protein n=1 Tax=Gracilibacillus dipsosauri TaxID=178340 RepID=UPI00240961BE
MDYEIFELGSVTLQSGVTLPHAFLAFKTYGTLNQDKSNVVVYPTAFGDTQDTSTPEALATSLQALPRA